jgi:hypothetical protein
MGGLRTSKLGMDGLAAALAAPAREASSSSAHHAPPPQPATPPCRFLTLPDDIAQSILAVCTARSLGTLSGTCVGLRERCHDVAEARMRTYQPTYFRAHQAIEHARPQWARALSSVESLVEAVGPRPACGRKWWHEWGSMREAEAERTGQQPVDVRSFGPGGERSIKALLREYAAGLSWMVDAGWAPLQASAAMLLLSCGSAALGHSIRERSPAFAASAHALLDALRQRAWAISTAAPPTFASIDGMFGLARADPAWCTLLDNNVRVGHTFITSAPVQASLHPTHATQPDVADAANASAVEAVAADGGGPLHRVSSAACEQRLGGPIVCFLSEVRPMAGDSLRTLIQTSPIGFALPPLARVRLVAMHDPGEWRDDTGPVWRRTFCVTVGCDY